jgi:type II secretory pathway component GspD/PulD (secretin)
MRQRFITLFFTTLIFTAMSIAQESLPAVSTVSTESTTQNSSLILMPKQKQMLYEVRMIRVHNSEIKNIDILWDDTPGVSADTPLKETVNLGRIGRTTSTTNATLGTLFKSKKATLLTSPSLSSLEGVEASTFIGDQFKYIISLQQTPQGVNVQTDEARIGITLKVKGQSSNDGSITMFVHPEVSTISGYVNVGQIALPQISTRFVDATVRMKDGETIVIAGLTKEAEQENTTKTPEQESMTKVPRLEDMPTLKSLFPHVHKEKSNSQIVVFITAKIQKD